MGKNINNNSRRIMLLVQEIRAMTDEVMELMAEGVEATSFHAQLARNIAVEIDCLSAWQIHEFDRYTAMCPRSKGKLGRNGLFITGNRNHYAAINVHSRIVANLEPQPNEVQPDRRHYNTRKFVFDDFESVVDFLENIEDQLLNFH